MELVPIRRFDVIRQNAPFFAVMFANMITATALVLAVLSLLWNR